MVRSAPVHILIDYRPALRQRTGVGEYVHRLTEALVPQLDTRDELSLFSSSWKDRLSETPRGTRPVDVRIPVTALNFAWHRLEWPPVERFGVRPDVTWSLHPLLMPSRRAARVVTVHDLHFLDRPADTTREIRRDYPTLAARHAARADLVVVNSAYTRDQAITRLRVAADRICVCHPGAPALTPRPNTTDAGPILHLGTIEPRKNVTTLIKAYRQLAERRRGVPPLVLAGKMTEPVAFVSGPGLFPDRIRFLGYVDEAEKQRLLATASMLVIPSVEEGFGMPALEAMAAGLPVVAANRGALPEVIGEAGVLADVDTPDGLAAAMERVLFDAALREGLRQRGLEQARRFRWDQSAARLLDAFRRIHLTRPAAP